MDVYQYVSNMVREKRNVKNITQLELAEELGISQQALQLYESNKRKIPMDVLFKIADILDFKVNSFFPTDSEGNTFIDEDTIKIPVLGIIPAGIPIEAIEDIIDYEEIPLEWVKGGKEYFGLKIKGDSMFPKYQENDTVIFEKANDCESGDECCIIINGDDATFKKVLKHDAGLTLQPLNNAYDLQMYSKEDIKKLPIRIIGIAVEMRRKI